LSSSSESAYPLSEVIAKPSYICLANKRSVPERRKKHKYASCEKLDETENPCQHRHTMEKK